MTPSLPDVATLPASEAVRLLAALVGQTGEVPVPEQLRAVEGRLRDAARHHGTPVAGGPISAGDLARAALGYLAAAPERQAIVARAAAEPLDTSRFEPETLAVGALIVVALHRELELKAGPDGHWALLVRRAALRDAALGALVGKLVTHYRQ